MYVVIQLIQHWRTDEHVNGKSYETTENNMWGNYMTYSFKMKVNAADLQFKQLLWDADVFLLSWLYRDLVSENE